MPEVLTVTEVAKFLRISTETVYRLAKRGELRGRKIGRIWRFRRRDVGDFLSDRGGNTPYESGQPPVETTNDGEARHAIPEIYGGGA